MAAGRPMIYDTVDKLQDAITEYFKTKEEQEKMPTKTGLAYELGFESRQSIYDYANRGDEFSYTIKRALLYMESIVEERLYGPNSTGAIFWLKNVGWKDKQEVESTIKDYTVLDKVLQQIEE